MGLRARWFATLALAMALVSPILTTGCSEHHYQVYESYYHGYHHWSNGEEDYYRQRATEKHRDPDRDYRRLDKDDQQHYRQWRHQQDHDHDHDHDSRS